MKLLSPIGLSTIYLPPKFFGSLKGLQIFKILPNSFEYLITDSGGNYLYKQAYDFAYKNHLLLKNVGEFVISLITIFLFWFASYIIFNLTKWKSSFLNLINRHS